MGLAQLVSLNSASDDGSASQALHILQGKALSPLQPLLSSLCPLHPGWGRAGPAMVAWWERGLLQPVQVVGWKQTEGLIGKLLDLCAISHAAAVELILAELKT